MLKRTVLGVIYLQADRGSPDESGFGCGFWSAQLLIVR
jgi:hypothetical protein